MHDYLRMKLEYTTKGKVRIDMNEYLDNIMIELPEKYKGTAVKLAVNHIVEVNENAKKLTEDTAQVFYIGAAKLLFLSM